LFYAYTIKVNDSRESSDIVRMTNCRWHE